MGDKNELNIRLENGKGRSAETDSLETQSRHLADQCRRLVRDLTNGAVGLRLVRVMVVEGFNGRKTKKRRQSGKGCKPQECFHNFIMVTL